MLSLHLRKVNYEIGQAIKEIQQRFIRPIFLVICYTPHFPPYLSPFIDTCLQKGNLVIEIQLCAATFQDFQTLKMKESKCQVISWLSLKELISK